MRSLCILLVALALLPCPAPAQSLDAAGLLALHHRYVGWQFGDGTFTTLRTTGTATRDDGVQTYPWTTMQMGAVYRDILVDPRTGNPTDDGFTGRIFWQSDANGFTRPDYSERQHLNVSNSVLFNEGTSELTGTLQAPVTIGGTSYPVVRVQPPDGDVTDLAVDPATGAYVRAVIDPGGPYERTIDILGYREALPGKRIISKYRIGHWLFDATTLQPNVQISLSDFHPPLPTATWDFANPNPFHISVKRHAIFVTASFNGVQGRFILDTGAAGIFIDNGFADRAHLPIVTTSHAGGIGPNVVRTNVRRVRALTIGGNTLSNVLVATTHFDMPWDEGNGDIEHPAGVIGFPLFGGAIVTVSTSNQTMTISDPNTTRVDTSAGAPIRVDLSGEVPVVPMVIDNRVHVNALLDTGDGSFVAMSPDLVTRRGVPMMAHNYQGNVFSHPDDPNDVQDYVNSHIVVIGIGGEEVESCSNISSIALGPIVYQGSYACTSPSITGDNIIVGYRFLRNFDFVFDYHDGIMILKPHPQ